MLCLTRGQGARRCLVVGDAAAKGRKQGFVIAAFETVLRLHSASSPSVDVGNKSRGVWCADGAACMLAAQRAGCVKPDELLSLGRERDLPPTRTLLNDVFLPKLGTFGGPPSTR